jgi:hypothetical protein
VRGHGAGEGPPRFFDAGRQPEAISAKDDPLVIIKTSVPWKDIRADIEAVRETKPEERMNNTGLMNLARTMRIARTILPPVKFCWWPNTSSTRGHMLAHVVLGAACGRSTLTMRHCPEQHPHLFSTSLVSALFYWQAVSGAPRFV